MLNAEALWPQRNMILTDTRLISSVKHTEMQDYNEEQVFARYIWTHYRQYLSSFEWKVGKAIFGRRKYGHEPINESRKKMLELTGGFGDSEVEKALEVGVDHFELKVAQRIFEEHRDEIFINRCLDCRKIVGTPKARLCKWCGHTWYDKEVGYRGEE